MYVERGRSVSAWLVEAVIVFQKRVHKTLFGCRVCLLMGFGYKGACMPATRRRTFRWYHTHRMDALFAGGWWVDEELEHLFGSTAS